MHLYKSLDETIDNEIFRMQDLSSRKPLYYTIINILLYLDL